MPRTKRKYVNNLIIIYLRSELWRGIFISRKVGRIRKILKSIILSSIYTGWILMFYINSIEKRKFGNRIFSISRFQEWTLLVLVGKLFQYLFWKGPFGFQPFSSLVTRNSLGLPAESCKQRAWCEYSEARAEPNYRRILYAAVSYCWVVTITDLPK